MIRRAALVSAFAAVLMLLQLGQRFIVTGDEARFAVLAQDMLTRGTWVDARVRDQRYRNKPLLYPWAIKVLSMPGGRVTEATAQLPIVIGATPPSSSRPCWASSSSGPRPACPPV